MPMEYNLFKLIEQIREIDVKLESNPSDVILLMSRGKLLYQNAEHDRALNDFNAVLEIDPENKEALAYVDLIKGIFSFGYTEQFNV